MRPKIEIYPDAAGRFRWRVVAPNGRTTASSGESFDSKGNAKRAARAFLASPPVEDVPEPTVTDGELG